MSSTKYLVLVALLFALHISRNMADFSSYSGFEQQEAKPSQKPLDPCMTWDSKATPCPKIFPTPLHPRPHVPPPPPTHAPAPAPKHKWG